jgi:hypothetical protein
MHCTAGEASGGQLSPGAYVGVSGGMRRTGPPVEYGSGEGTPRASRSSRGFRWGPQSNRDVCRQAGAALAWAEAAGVDAG